MCGRGENLFCAGECFDLLTDDFDASIVGGIELQYHLSHVLCAIDVTGKCEDSGGLSGAWGPVEEEMRESVVFYETIDGAEDVGMPRDI